MYNLWYKINIKIIFIIKLQLSDAQLIFFKYWVLIILIFQNKKESDVQNNSKIKTKTKVKGGIKCQYYQVFMV